MVLSVLSVALDAEDRLNHTLEIDKQTNVVKWRVGLTVMRQMTIGSKVSHALFTSFKGEKTAVVVSKEMVHTFTLIGSTESMSLPFVPDTVVPSDEGVVFTSAGAIYLMTDPLKLLGVISPSSTSSISKRDVPLFFGNQSSPIAVFGDWSTPGDETSRLTFYAIRILETSRPHSNRQPSSRGSKRYSSVSAVSAKRRVTSFSARELVSEQNTAVDQLPIVEDSLISLQKQALISKFGESGMKFHRTVQIIAHKFGDRFALYLFDPAQQELEVHVMGASFRSEWTRTYKANGMTEIEGVTVGTKLFPYVALIMPTLEVELFSAFFPQEVLHVAISPPRKITERIQHMYKNTLRVIPHTGTPLYLALQLSSVSSLQKECLRALSTILDERALLMLGLLTISLTPEQGLLSWTNFSLICIVRFCDMASIPEECLRKSRYLRLAKQLQTSQLKELSFEYIYDAMSVLHLLREEYTLDARGSASVANLDVLLSTLAKYCGWDEGVEYYGDQSLFEITLSSQPLLTNAKPPNIYAKLVAILESQTYEYPKLPGGSLYPLTNLCVHVYSILGELSNDQATKLKSLLTQSDVAELVDRLASGVKLPVVELLNKISTSFYAPSIEQYKLLGRRDLMLTSASKPGYGVRIPRTRIANEHKDVKVLARELSTVSTFHEDPSMQARLAISKLVFQADRRFNEVLKLLQTSNVHVVSLTLPGDADEHEGVELQTMLSQNVALRTMSAVFGTAAVNFSGRAPLISERVETPALEFSIFLREPKTTVVFDRARMPPHAISTGHFHYGVSIGLSVSRDATNVTGSWIVFNKPSSAEELDVHAGFLLGLGLNGHLASLEEWYIYTYLGSKDTNTTIGVLVGLCASKIGSADPKLTRVLSVHLGALLPPGSNDLNIASDNQTAAALGLGLLYCGTQHRRMTEVLLMDILSSSERKNLVYKHACGVALGLVNVGKGPDLQGVADIHVVEKLERVVSFRTDTPQNPAMDGSTPAAIISLTLMFLQSGNAAVASMVKPPSTKSSAAYVLPYNLFLRSLSYQLIMWDSIKKDREWLESTVPTPLRQDISKLESLDTDHLPFYNILGASLVALAIKHVGSQDEGVMSTLLYYLDHFRRLTDSFAVSTGGMTQDESVTLLNIAQLQGSILLAASYVVAGSGYVPLLQRLRPLFGRTKRDELTSIDGALYTEFVAVSQAMGVLFLGAGQYSLKSDVFSIASLVTSVLLLPFSGADAMLWQLYRYFWAFATERRCLVVRDSETEDLVQVAVDVVLRDGTFSSIAAPALLPELSSIKSIQIQNPSLSPIALDFDEPTPALDGFKRSLTLYVQVRTLSSTLKPARSISEKVVRYVDKIEQDIAQLELMSLDPSRDSRFLWNLRLLFSFVGVWDSESQGFTYLSPKRVDDMKLNLWKARHRERTGWHPQPYDPWNSPKLENKD